MNLEAYQALDRLNSWMRSREPLWSQFRSAIKGTVYWTKNQAILDAHREGAAALRRVCVVMQCRSCGGSGTWHDWRDYWDEHDEDRGEPCLTCKATGKVELRFIESTIGDIRWHTPEPHWRSSSLDVYCGFSCDGDYATATDWQPNTPGKPLTNEEALRDILTVLEQWPHEVCFHLDFCHHTALERTFKCPDVALARKLLIAMAENDGHFTLFDVCRPFTRSSLQPA